MTEQPDPAQPCDCPEPVDPPEFTGTTARCGCGATIFRGHKLCWEWDAATAYADSYSPWLSLDGVPLKHPPNAQPSREQLDAARAGFEPGGVRGQLNEMSRAYQRAPIVEQHPEPWLKLRADGTVLLCAPAGDRIGERERSWELSPQRMHTLHDTLAMFLRMTGAEPDVEHPWFQGLAVDGEVYEELRRGTQAYDEKVNDGHGSKDWLAHEVAARLTVLVKQNEARRAQHWQAMNEAAATAGGHANLNFGYQSRPDSAG